MRRKTSYEDFQVVCTPGRLKNWRRAVTYRMRDRLRKDVADLVVYRLTAPCPAVKGKKIAFVSDLHFQNSRQDHKILACLQRYLQELKPELLLFGGDVCSDADSLEFIPEALKKLSETVPYALAVPGNWERGKSWIPAARWKEIFSAGGFEIAFNQLLEVGGFQIFCADDPAYGNPVAPEKWQQDKCRLLLAHRPDTVIALDTPQTAVFDLALCGHTHGGQVRFPLIGAVFAASIYGCALDYGLFEHRNKKCKMIVSSGLGQMSFPWRINCRREMVLIEFV